MSEKREGVVYCYTNKINGKQYVGKTINEKVRKYHHMRDALICNSKLTFHKAIRKYGWDNFNYTILYRGSDLMAQEVFWISKLNTYKKGYNSTLGGEGCVGRVVTKETRLKMSGKNNPLFGKRGNECVNSKKVYQFTIEGELVKIHESVMLAADEIGIDFSTIAKAARGDVNICASFRWSYTDKPDLKEPKIKQIHQFNLNGDYLNTFSSPKEAAEFIGTKYTSGITKTARGKKKTAHGFIWKYNI